MKYIAIAIIAALLLTSAQAQIEPPHQVQVENGIAVFGWENSVGADTVVATLDRADCPIAARGAPGDTGDPQQAFTQIPQGPPYDERCRIRPYDRITLLLYRDDVYVGQLGPYIPRVRVYLPMMRTP